MPVWSQNGLGCETDNSVVGGDGGYTSYPQPPSPGGFAEANQPPITLPEKTGQFGPSSLTYLSVGGNFFVMTNPGRSD